MKGKIQNVNDVKFYDYTAFPKEFKTQEEAVDTYNDLGHSHKIQFQVAYPSSKDGFTLECPFSRMCQVRAKFTWNASKKRYVREKNVSFFHDHCVQLMPIERMYDRFQAEKYIRESNKGIKPHDLAKLVGLQPFEAVHLIKSTKLTNQEVPRAIINYSDSYKSITHRNLVNDLQILKDQKPLSTIIYNEKDGKAMLFVQTGDMLEMLKRNYEPGILMTIIPKQVSINKYNLNEILFTGIDQTIGNIITVGFGLFAQNDKYSYKWILKQLQKQFKLINKALKNFIIPFNKTVFKLAKKLIPNAKIYIQHESVLHYFQQIIDKVPAEVKEPIVELFEEVLISDKEKRSKALLQNIKQLLVKNVDVYDSIIEDVMTYNEYFQPIYFNDIFTGGLHSYNRSAAVNVFFRSQVEKYEDKLKYNEVGEVLQQRGIQLILEQCILLEKTNETYYFQFDHNLSENLTSSALYLSIKKAFTPYACLYILKQMILAHEFKEQINIKEKEPFVKYKLEFTDQSISYKLTGSKDSNSLKNLSCTCAFFNNFKLICCHQIALLWKLQLKTVSPFEHLRKFREIVGVKNKEKCGEKKSSDAYQVTKSKRLRSFIEDITNKHNKRIKKIAQEKGISIMRKEAGDFQTAFENNEYEQLNKEAKMRESQKKRNTKKSKK